MTWGECKAAALRKMFGSDGGRIDYSEPGNADYIAAMPAAANEAMERIVSTAGRPLRKSADIDMEEDVQYLDMSEQVGDFRAFGEYLEVYLVVGSGLAALDAAAIGQSVLQLPKGVSGTVRVFYDAVPEHITEYTNDAEELPLSDDCNVLIPLYLAGELYKDDDIGMATAYMNEFESRLSSLPATESGVRDGSFTSLTGWW